MQSIKEIKHIRKTRSRWHNESYEMTFVLNGSENPFSEYVRKDKDGWSFYGSSCWFLFRENDQKTINDYMSSQK